MRGLRHLLSITGMVAYLSKRRRWIGIIVALFLSLVLWFVVALNNPEGYTKHIEIPLEPPVPPAQYTLTEMSRYPKVLKVGMHASGWNLLQYTLTHLFYNPKPFRPLVDSLSLSENGGRWTLTGESLRSQILTYVLPSARSIVADTLTNITVSPRSISFGYEPLRSLAAKVSFTTPLDFGDHINLRLLGKPQITPEVVNIFAPRSTIDAIKAESLIVTTDTIPISIVNEGEITVPLKIISPTGTQASPSVVYAKILTDELAHKTFTYSNIRVEHLSPKYTLTLLTPTVKVTVLAPKKASKNTIDAFWGDDLGEIELYIDATDLPNENISKLPIKVRHLPPYVEMLQLDPDRLDYLLKEKK